MTREHVFARWLVLKLRGARLVATSAEPAADAAARISRVLADVCADCNAGWMSGLEVSFRHVLFGGVRAGNIQPPDRTTLSRWFTKTAILLADARGDALVPRTQRPQLIDGMPPGVEVFIGRRRRPRQRLDYAYATSSQSELRAVGVLVDDLVGTVAPRRALTNADGTRLWPLRTHALRWETLPLVGAAATRRT